MGSPPTEREECESYRPAHDEVFVANVTEETDGAETCSISPLPKNKWTPEFEWVAAVDGSFVSLDEMR